MGKLCFDCAGASGSRVGPYRKPEKNKENATCEPSRSGGRFFMEKVILQMGNTPSRLIDLFAGNSDFLRVGKEPMFFYVGGKYEPFSFRIF